MNLERKAFGDVWHAWSEQHAHRCVMYLIHSHILNPICLTIQIFLQADEDDLIQKLESITIK